MDIRYRGTVAVIALLWACTFGPEEWPEGMGAGVTPGVLVWNGSPVQIEVPDSVQADEVFTVRIFTYGGGCRARSHVEATLQGRVLEVHPFDENRRAGILPNGIASFCSASRIVMLPHEALGRFAAAGPAVVRVRGRHWPSDVDLTVEFPITVRP